MGQQPHQRTLQSHRAAGLRPGHRRLLHQPARGAQHLRGLQSRPINPPRVPRVDRRARCVHGRSPPGRAPGDPRPQERDPTEGVHRRDVHWQRRGRQAASRERRIAETDRTTAEIRSKRVRYLWRAEISCVRRVQRKPQGVHGEEWVQELYILQCERSDQVPFLFFPAPASHQIITSPNLSLSTPKGRGEISN